MEYHIKKAGRCKCEETALQDKMTTEPHKPKQNGTGIIIIIFKNGEVNCTQHKLFNKIKQVWSKKCMLNSSLLLF